MHGSGVRVGLDIGKVRTGIARSDASGTIVFAHGVVLTERLAEEIREIVSAYEPVVFYVGLPVDLKGEIGVAAKGVRDFTESLFEGIQIPVVFSDERMTTKIAESRLRNLDHSHREMRSTIDAMAAVVLLEDAIERESFNHE